MRILGNQPLAFQIPFFNKIPSLARSVELATINHGVNER